MAYEFEMAFEAARRGLGLPYDARLVETGGGAQALRTAPEPAIVEPPKREAGAVENIAGTRRQVTLAQVYEKYLNDPTKKRSKRTHLAHETTRRLALEVLGADTPIDRITREQCRDLLEILRWLPVNCGKFFEGLSMREAAERAKADRSIRTINVTNVNAYMARFAAAMNWALTEEFIERNPAKGIRWAENAPTQDRRRPFSSEQLRRIFSAPVFVGCKDEGRGYATPGPLRLGGAKFWIPLLGLFTGARLNELCQADVADIQTIDGIHCLVISAESESGNSGKSLKNKSSARRIPLHPALLELGFMAFVRRKRATNSEKLFDDIPAGALGFRSIAFSRWFARFLTRAKAETRTTCFHSFRHGFRDAARNARIDRDIVLALGGWTSGGQSDAADQYGQGYHPAILLEAIRLIEYPGLDLSHLEPR
ncbi:tyrosine-type recombinase/integrase [Sphingobium yanoikuyae]|uniref:tyrosine-type recombinase/integrase n=1 Tax=Sphingobium yanoikuyae TaxID=13690 RepID=UPI003F05A10D